MHWQAARTVVRALGVYVGKDGKPQHALLIISASLVEVLERENPLVRRWRPKIHCIYVAGEKRLAEERCLRSGTYVFEEGGDHLTVSTISKLVCDAANLLIIKYKTD